MAIKRARKIVYVLGAGFSCGTGHVVSHGTSHLDMPIQNNLLERIFQYQYRKSEELDDLAKIIRKYFTSTGYRAKRKPGASRHGDLNHLSVEEIVTFFEEMARDSKREGDVEVFRSAETRLRLLTLELISFLSLGGSPNTNKTLKAFRNLILTTDTVISFNWDTLLDRALSKNTEREWHPAWGYGSTVRSLFKCDKKYPTAIPTKHPTLLKLHGSINWVASGEDCVVHADFSPKSRLKDVVMMPPKMLKQEIWGGEPTSDKSEPLSGNWAMHEKRLYPQLWKEAEESLNKAKRVVFIGYSFPTADTSVYGLLRRSLAVSKDRHKQYPDIHIVDPNAASLAKRFADSFNIAIPIQNQYLSLHSYVTARDRG